MLTDAEGDIGDAIHLVDQASKGSCGREIPLNKELGAASSTRRGRTSIAEKSGSILLNWVGGMRSNDLALTKVGYH